MHILNILSISAIFGLNGAFYPNSAGMRVTNESHLSHGLVHNLRSKSVGTVWTYPDLSTIISAFHVLVLGLIYRDFRGSAHFLLGFPQDQYFPANLILEEKIF